MHTRPRCYPNYAFLLWETKIIKVKTPPENFPSIYINRLYIGETGNKGNKSSKRCWLFKKVRFTDEKYTGLAYLFY